MPVEYLFALCNLNRLRAKEPFDYEKKIDELLDKAAIEFDFAKRKALASESLGNVEAFTANAFGVQELLAVIFRK